MSMLFGGYNSYTTNRTYGAESNGYADIIMESFDDDLEIIRAMHRLDINEMRGKAKLKSLQESYNHDSNDIDDAEEEFKDVMEASVGGVWDSIKEKMKKLWAKIKQFFAAVKRFFIGLFGSAKTFVDKYKKELQKLKLTGYKYEMFIYTLDALNEYKLPTDYLGISSEIINESDIDKAKQWDNDSEKIKDEYKAAIFDKGYLSDTLFKKFRDGKDDPEERSVDISKIISEIENGTKALKLVNKDEARVDKKMTRFLKAVDSSAKTATNAVGEGEGADERKTTIAKVAKFYSDVYSYDSTISMTVLGALKTAINEMLSTYKNVCIKAFRYKEEKK